MHNTGQTATQRFNKRFGVTGPAYCPDATLGDCYVSFFGQKTEYPNYTVLDSDFDNYAVVYTCEADDEFAYLWFLARQP